MAPDAMQPDTFVTSCAGDKRARIRAVDLAAIMIDGLGFGDEGVVLIALGIHRVGRKHVLGNHEGATENATACGALLDDLIALGVDEKRSMLFVVDGAKALFKAIRERFGERAVIQRCQVTILRSPEC